MTTAGWDVTAAAEGVVSVAYAGEAPGEPALTYPALVQALDLARHRVVLATGLERWPAPGPGLLGHPLPVVAALRGTIAGAALLPALATDIRVASGDLSLEIRSEAGGPIVDPLTIALLAQLVGAGTAGYWILTRRRVEAAEAHEAGLVQQVVPDGEVERTALETASTVAEGAPLALEYAKEALARGRRLGLVDAIDLEYDLYAILQTTADRAEGVRAFLERREPSFGGD